MNIDHRRAQIRALGGFAILPLVHFCAPIDAQWTAWGAYMIGLITAYIIKRTKRAPEPTVAEPTASIPPPPTLDKRYRRIRMAGALFSGAMIYLFAPLLPFACAIASYIAGLVTVTFAQSLRASEEDLPAPTA